MTILGALPVILIIYLLNNVSELLSLRKIILFFSGFSTIFLAASPFLRINLAANIQPNYLGMFLSTIYFLKIVSNYYVFTNMIIKNMMKYMYKLYRKKANFIFLLMKKSLTSLLFSLFFIL